MSTEEAAQIGRLRYVPSHGPKEGLVERPTDWPGLHVAKDLAEERTIEGYWFDRTQEYAARRRGESFDRLRFATRETLILSPLPCWKGLSEGAWRRRAADLVAEIESEFAAQRAQTGRQPLGVSAVLSQHDLTASFPAGSFPPALPFVAV